MSKYDSCIFLSSGDTVEWKDLFSKMKPGAHAVAICPVLEHHRITQRVEDAGFEIRDSILFLGEPSLIVTLARVPLEGTVAQNVLKHGVGTINVDRCRIKTKDDLSKLNITSPFGKSRTFSGGVAKARLENNSLEGRWPANTILSSCTGVVKGLPDTGISRGGNSLQINSGSGKYNWNAGDKKDSPNKIDPGYGDSGSAARYFHNIPGENNLEGLVAYLHKLITPPGGTTLFIPDPFPQ